MYDKSRPEALFRSRSLCRSRLSCPSFAALSDILQNPPEAFHAAFLKALPALSAWEREGSTAVYPGLISRISGQLLIIPILKFPKVAFPELLEYSHRNTRKENFRRLQAALHGACIYGVRPDTSQPFFRILCKRRPALFTERLICRADITAKRISVRLSMPDKKKLRYPLITVPIPQTTR